MDLSSGRLGQRSALKAPNSALVGDACATALRAFFSAPQRGR
jgi:hypothetical protein